MIISTRQGNTYEAEVCDYRDANREIDHFRREYLLDNPGDIIIDISVVDHGNVIARYRNGGVEEF